MLVRQAFSNAFIGCHAADPIKVESRAALFANTLPQKVYKIGVSNRNTVLKLHDSLLSVQNPALYVGDLDIGNELVGLQFTDLNVVFIHRHFGLEVDLSYSARF